MIQIIILSNSFLMNTNTPNYSEFYIDEDDERGYYNEQVGETY